VSIFLLDRVQRRRERRKKHARMSATPDSSNVMTEGMSNKNKIRLINSVLRRNMGFVAIGVVFVIVAIILVVIFVRRIVNTVNDHYQYAVRQEPAKRPTVAMALGDDEVYQEDLMGVREDPGSGDKDRSEFAKMRARIEDIERHYSTYNKEFGSYIRDKKNREPDDLIDARIVSRASDDYEYDKKR